MQICVLPGSQMGTNEAHTGSVQTCTLGESHTGTSGIQQQGKTTLLQFCIKFLRSLTYSNTLDYTN